jgi:Na+/H+ antiporter NhaD/arsenite permease-like protein
LGTLHLGHAVQLPVTDLVRNLIVFSLAGISVWIKPLAQRAQEKWHVQPLWELVVLFFGIFITAEPLVHWLHNTLAHSQGGVLSILTTPSATQALAYFWGTGLLSSCLDNAPTYLIFFSLAGGSAPALTGPLALILTAISTGAVFMGALTYIGNAPNLLVKTIVEEEYALSMPSFLTYTFWAILVLMPPLVVWSLWAL